LKLFYSNKTSYYLLKAIMNSELNIDYTLLPENVPAICVPYVFDNILESRMTGIFNALSIGEVSRIDEVPYTAADGKKVKRVFVHLKWKIDPNANKIRTKLLCGKKVKVLYDDPWWWEISASRAKETPKREPAPVQSRKPRIELDDEVVSRPKQDQYQRPKHRDYRPKSEALPMAPTLPMAPIMPISLLPPTPLQVEEFVPTTPPTPPQDDDDEEEFPALPTKLGKNYGDIDQPQEVPTGIDYNVSNLPIPEKKKRVTKKAPAAKTEAAKTEPTTEAAKTEAAKTEADA
jgi:hypothetical protein